VEGVGTGLGADKSRTEERWGVEIVRFPRVTGTLKVIGIVAWRAGAFTTRPELRDRVAAESEVCWAEVETAVNNVKAVNTTQVRIHTLPSNGGYSFESIR
jgi:hypothetical protein